jgi:TP901 family phage tail tape measure protein
MARIAGMDYAEAADAMTVAIRSFKMEMTDAAHVTDVYSKVAAVTASDSEELAIAMSKTASSAESVGSSFENTTAMLAVMIETTRESAQNLGSALKSIISRYGEMKVGMTVDSEGEALDYNKVDTALQSVGISLKDAQGQFRDFDEVIFELSEKWDSLDSVTQRYIATIMAGNRQQSRFIALVDNWERLDEVAGAA